jgi:hypothetical protein
MTAATGRPEQQRGDRMNAEVDFMDPALRCCGSCRFHDVAGLYDMYRTGADGMGNLGFCRRYPPRPRQPPLAAEREKWTRTDYMVFGEYPETSEDEWCGEWAEGHRSFLERFGIEPTQAQP